MRKQINFISYSLISAFLLIFIKKGDNLAIWIMGILNLVFWYNQLKGW